MDDRKHDPKPSDDLPRVRVDAARAIRFIAEVATGAINAIAEQAAAAVSGESEADEVAFRCPACHRRATCRVFAGGAGVELHHEVPPCSPFEQRDRDYVRAVQAVVREAVQREHPHAAREGSAPN